MQISLDKLEEVGSEDVGVGPGPVLTLLVVLLSVDEAHAEASDEKAQVIVGQFEAFLLGRLRTEPVTMEQYRVLDDLRATPRSNWD